MKIIELKLDDLKTGEGITAISLVKNPAFEANWVAFSDAENIDDILKDKRYAFKSIDEDQRIIVGPGLIPDKMIYRRNDAGEESFVYFSVDTIRELAERFLLQGRQNNLTIEHRDTLNDLFVVESWIVEDPARDKSTVYGYDLPVGTWFVKVKVLNDFVWDAVKNGDVLGFSVEGVFTHELIKNQKQMKTTKLDDYLSQIRALFTDEPTPEPKPEVFGSVDATAPGGEAVAISFPGDVLEAGVTATIVVGEEELPIPTGEYALPDDMVAIVADEGTIGEIRAAEPAEEPEPEPAAEGMSAEQIDKIVNGIAEVLATFSEEIRTETTEAIEASANAIRAEFNKPAVKVTKTAPEPTPKEKVVVGLNKFIRDKSK